MRMLRELLLEADARGRGRVFAPALDWREARAAIEGERRVLIDAGLEHEATHTQLLRGSLEAGQHRPSDSLAPLSGSDAHPLRPGGPHAEPADGAAPDPPAFL